MRAKSWQGFSKETQETSLVVQWLGLQAFSAGRYGLDPWSGNLRSHMPGDSGKKEKTPDPGDKGMKGPQGPGAPRVMAETRVKREEESSKHG